MVLFNSAINETWKLCSLGGFLGLLLLTLLLSGNPQTVQISNSRTVIALVQSSDQPPATIAPSPASTVAISPQSSYNILTTHLPAASPSPAALTFYVETNSKNSSNPTAVDVSPAENKTSFNSTEFIETFNSSTTSLEEKLFTSGQTESVVGSTWAEDEKAGSASDVEKAEVEGKIMGGGGGQKCKLYEGRWVYKPEENPRYHVYQCPFLEEKMSCQKNGRPDFEYEGWTWESNDCQIPLFDAKNMLEKMRGKRMLIAGDSLNRNKWESLACLLYSALSPHRVFVDAADPGYKVLKALDYGFTLEFYWAPFLVNFDTTRKSGRKIVVIDKLVPASKKWIGADVMVFNSGHWWTHDHGPFKPYDAFEYKGKQIEVMKTEIAYERALSTWADWLARHVDPTKTKVYFRSISPEHKNKDWCYNSSRPIQDESYVQLYPRSMINVVEGKLREINGRGGVHVNYLNITKLSTYRMDAHPGIFRFKHWKIITQKYKRLLKAKSDCSHWCLPGLPDTWNRILYASLFFDNFSPGDVSGS